jgi:hypothetical protein
VAAAVLLGVSLVAGPAACGDGRPAFCDDLSEQAALDGLTSALEGGDLGAAAEEAAALRDLASAAPREIRPQFEALASGVVDLVALLEAERAPGDGGDADGPTPDDGNVTDPAEVERLRKELNDRLGELTDDSSEVSAWTEENCGFSLT